MPTTKQNNLFPWLIVFYEISIYLSMDTYAPAFVKIAQSYTVNSHMVQLTAITWLLGGLLFQFIVGPLSDRYGRRPILLWGGVLYVASCIVCATAPTIHTLIYARLFQGMSMPTMYIAGYAAINECFESTQAIKILARLNSVTILAPAIGPILGGAFILYFNWHWIFVILAVMSSSALLLLYHYMPETLTKEARATRLHLGEITQSYGSVLSNGPFIRYALIAFLPITGLIAWMLAGPFIVIDQLHHTALVFGLLQTLVFVSFILGNRLTSYLADKQNHQRTILIGLGLAALGTLSAILLTSILPENLLAFIFCLSFSMFGIGLILPILSRLTLEQSNAPMGIKVTIFSVIRMGSGFIGAVCLTLMPKDSLFYIAIVMLVFTMIAVALKTVHYISDKK